MDIYTDYANWKVEKFDLLNTLIQNESAIIQRIYPVYLVLDYLYDILVEKKRNLTADEEYIFESGFNYLHDKIMTIETLLVSTFNNNLIALEHCAKSVNLLLYVEDFEDELLNATDNIDQDMQELENFANKILEQLEKHKNVDDTLFLMFDEMTIPMFKRHNLEINPVESIFYEIALTYDLLTEKDDIYNDFITEKIEGDKHEHEHEHGHHHCHKE